MRGFATYSMELSRSGGYRAFCYILGFTEFYRVVTGLIKFYRALHGFRGFCRLSKGLGVLE